MDENDNICSEPLCTTPLGPYKENQEICNMCYNRKLAESAVVDASFKRCRRCNARDTIQNRLITIDSDFGEFWCRKCKIESYLNYGRDPRTTIGGKIWAFFKAYF